MKNTKHIDPDPKTSKEIEELIDNRLAGKEMIRKAAIKGDSICGAVFALESLAGELGLGYIANTAIDYSEDDDDGSDIRPY